MWPVQQCLDGAWAVFRFTGNCLNNRDVEGSSVNRKEVAQFPLFLTCLWVLDSVWTPKRLVIAMLSDRIWILHLFWNYKYHRELGCASTNRSCCFKEDELQCQQVLFFNLTPSVCMKRTQQSKLLNDKLSNWSYHAMNRLSSRPEMNLRGSRRQECTTLIMEKLGCCVKVNRNAM